MIVTADYIVVGAGITGATIARVLADAGREVAVIDRRSHLGGNCHDQRHVSGIQFNTYGPHYFRTSSERIWDFVRRFSSFRKYEARVLTYAMDRLWKWPLHRTELSSLLHGNWDVGFSGAPRTFEEAALAQMPEKIYRVFIEGYTTKQWGVPPHALLPDVAKRFDVRSDGDDRLSRHRFQGIPDNGYTAWISSMLDGIPTSLGTDYLQNRSGFRFRKYLVFTGAIDEYFGHRYGRLRYRGQRRETTYSQTINTMQPSVQVNYPEISFKPTIRAIEWKHLMRPADRERIVGTLTTTETPVEATNVDEYEYPFPDSHNQALYAQYSRLSSALANVLICGRLGEYRYLDMDQAIGRALTLGQQLLRESL